MKCQYGNAIIELKTIDKLRVGFCCNEWQVDEESLRPKVRDSYWYKEKGSR